MKYYEILYYVAKAIMIILILFILINYKNYGEKIKTEYKYYVVSFKIFICLLLIILYNPIIGVSKDTGFYLINPLKRSFEQSLTFDAGVLLLISTIMTSYDL